jgi:ribosomal protein L31E
MIRCPYYIKYCSRQLTIRMGGAHMGRTHMEIISLVRFTSSFLSLTEKQKQYILKHASTEQIIIIREIITNLLYNRGIEIDEQYKSRLKSELSKLLLITSEKYSIEYIRVNVFPKIFKIIIIALQAFLNIDGISEILSS